MLRRLARRLLAPPPTTNAPAQPPPRPAPTLTPSLPTATAPGPLPMVEPRPQRGVVLVDVATLLAAVSPRGRPVLVHHWASWDTTATADLPLLVALSGGGVDIVGVAWDEFAPAPLGRIAGMAQRPARWAGGAQVEAWVRQVGIDWPTLVFDGEPEALFEALRLADRWVPQLTLYGADGAVLAHHGGPCAGSASWERLVAATRR